MAKRKNRKSDYKGFGAPSQKESKRSAAKRSKSAGKMLATAGSSLSAAAAMLLMPGVAMALPQGLQIRGGELNISQPDGSTLIINQGTNRAAGDWESFDINAGQRVQINQPGKSSLLLNRITGGSATQILGSLSADGGVILVNPYGMLIGADATINTATLRPQLWILTLPSSCRVVHLSCHVRL